MEPLLDPRNDRMVKDIKPPPHRPLKQELLFPGKSGIPDWRVLRDHLSREGRLEKKHVLKIINDTATLLKTEPNLVKVKDPVMVVGDTHGQFYDFLQIITMKEKREEKNKIEIKFLFLGDYVDRGNFGLELLLVLYALKVDLAPDEAHIPPVGISTEREPRISPHDTVLQLPVGMSVQVRPGRV